jgi:[acyl-carrier-protein] S-malonyltransferase
MLAALAQQHPAVEETFNQASSVLDLDLWHLVQHGPDEALNKTENTQPAMLAAGVAVWRVWQEKAAVQPQLLAGHSLGEYTALVCSGALSFEDATAVVTQRARLMQEAVPAGEGAMAAIIGLTDQQVQQACDEASRGDVVQPVNYNSPGQVVIAGHSTAVQRAMDAAKALGAKRALPLPVSVPSHCLLMKPAAEKLAAVLEKVTIKAPGVSVINNVDVAAPTEAGLIRDALVRQLYNPVRWVETVQDIASRGCATVLECGPGKVLSGLNKRIDRSLSALPVHDDATLDAAAAAVSQ